MTSENGILLRTNGTTANVNINADGTNSEVTMNAKTRVSVTAPNIVLDGTTTIKDLTVTGTTTTVNSTNLAIKDNLIELNNGETGKGVTAGTAGIKVNRGDELPYLIQFDEADDRFKVGKQGSLETIASQNYVDEAISNVVFEHPETHPASMITGLAQVATTGSYNDLSNKPTIPAATNIANCAKVPDYSTKTQWTFKGTTYTAPADGFVIGVLNADGSGTDSTIYVNGQNVTWGNDKNPIVSLPVCKGDTVYAKYNHTDMYYYAAR
jgi:hypothetical protein